jgi:hypothetical protein
MTSFTNIGRFIVCGAAIVTKIRRAFTGVLKVDSTGWRGQICFDRKLVDTIGSSEGFQDPLDIPGVPGVACTTLELTVLSPWQTPCATMLSSRRETITIVQHRVVSSDYRALRFVSFISIVSMLLCFTFIARKP